MMEPRDTSWSIQLDQDVFYPPSADQNFTQGTEVGWSGRRTRGWAPHFAFRLIDLPFHFIHDWQLRKTDAQEINSYQFGFSAFTPRKGTKEDCLEPRWADNRVNSTGEGCILSETDPIPDDRPYAGLLYVRNRRTSLTDRTAWTSDLTIGVLGTGIGKAVQQGIHRLKHPPDVDPGGWHHQISNGGELTAKYRIAFRYLVKEGGELCGWPKVFDLTVSPEGSAGYYTNVAASGRLRVGLINSSPLTLERHASDPYFRRMKARGATSRNWEAYIWGTAAETLWGYNALLQGQFSDSDVMLRFDRGPAQLRRWVTDYQLGATLRIGRATFTYTRLTDHTRLFEGSDGHAWGSISIGFRPRLVPDLP